MSYGIANPLNPSQSFHQESYDDLVVFAIPFRALPVSVAAGKTYKKGLLLSINASSTAYEGVTDPTATNVSAVLMQDVTNNDANPASLSAMVGVGHFKLEKLFVLNASNDCVPVTNLTDAEISGLAVRNIVIHKTYL